MSERLHSENPGMVGKHKAEQIVAMTEWTQIPDLPHPNFATMTTVRQVPEGSSTVTYVNPLDPGDQSNSNWYDHNDGHDILLPAVNGGTA